MCAEYCMRKCVNVKKEVGSESAWKCSKEKCKITELFSAFQGVRDTRITSNGDMSPKKVLSIQPWSDQDFRGGKYESFFSDWD